MLSKSIYKICVSSGVINDILAWKFWTPMARLSYVFYLLHPIVIWIHEAFAHHVMYTSHYFWVSLQYLTILSILTTLLSS